jgi:hypothetical protein
MVSQITERANYPVEISGWDTQGTFFVVTASLDWNHSDTKTISLRGPLRPGSLVFLRLLLPVSQGNDCRNPYTVEVIEGPDRAGWSKLRLVQLQPRRGLIELPDESLEHLIQCVHTEVKP